MFDTIRADLARKRELYHAYHGWIHRYIRNVLDLGALAVIVYRFGNWIVRLRIPILRELLLLVYLPLKAVVIICAGVYIPARAVIGKGFVIHNFSGIFISLGTIGENCTVQQGVTIGGVKPNIWKGNPKPPRIGNNVYLGAGSKILGDITIGNHVVVGANSVVLTDVPDYCTVMGIPARIVSREENRDKPYGSPV
jgi:serine O-acetyltransferase